MLTRLNHKVNILTMKTITQAHIAKKLDISESFVSLLVNGVKRPSWKRAKQLAEIAGTSPILWLEGSPEEIKNALKEKATKE